jgi:hypothetical protein
MPGRSGTETDLLTVSRVYISGRLGDRIFFRGRRLASRNA